MAARAWTIVVGYDGSEGARRALEAAADLSGYGSYLAVVSVARGGEHGRGAPPEPNGHEGAASLLGEARDLLLRRHLTAHYLEPVGDPAEMLMEAARALDADLIVVGRRNQNALQRLVLGSVSSNVLRRAECDVLVVR